MQVESTPSRVFIYDLAAEIAEAEAAEAAEAADAAARPVFLPDVEKHLMRLPRSLLTGRGGGGGGGGGGSGGYEHKVGGAEDVGSDESDDGFDDDDPDEDTRTRRRRSGGGGAAKDMQLVKYGERPTAPTPLTFASSLAALSRERPSSTAHDRRTAAAEARRQRAWDFADADDGPWTGLGGARRSAPDLVAALAAAGVGGYPGDGDAMDIDMDLDLGGDL
jgi:hypothetical protein